MGGDCKIWEGFLHGKWREKKIQDFVSCVMEDEDSDKEDGNDDEWAFETTQNENK